LKILGCRYSIVRPLALTNRGYREKHRCQVAKMPSLPRTVDNDQGAALALHLSSRVGDVVAARAALAAGADPSSADSRVRLRVSFCTHALTPCQIGNTPLHLACSMGHLQIVALLLSSGADVCARNHLGLSPLARAAWKDELAIAQLLLSSGADVHAVNNVRHPRLSASAA